MTNSINNILVNCRQFWLMLLLWMTCAVLMPSVALAQQYENGCAVALQKSHYHDYLLSVEKTRVKRIQDALNTISNEDGDGGVLAVTGELVADGVLGADTREALYEFCRGLKVVPSENLLINLVKRLDQEAASTEQVPGDMPGVWYLLTKDDLAKIRDDLAKKRDEVLSARLPSEKAMTRLEMLLDIPYLTRAQFLRAVAAKSDIDKKVYPEFIKRITANALKKSSTKLKSIEIDASCGCVRNFSDTIYGFYPYWRSTLERDSASETVGDSAAAMAPAIDYSVITRIAYSALTLEENGDITLPSDWNDDGSLGNFINIAHRHKTEVDLVIYSDHWSKWSKWSDKKLLKTSVTSVYDQLTLQIEYKQRGMMVYVPFLNSSVASPDGVTLYFDGYFDHSKTPKARDNIVDFVKLLHEQLAKHKRDYKINILLDVDPTELVKEEKIFSDLEELLISIGDAPAYVDLLLVFLEEPTTDTKKILRSKIENEFKGANRMEVLRKVIPVLTPYDGHKHDEELAPYDGHKHDEELAPYEHDKDPKTGKNDKGPKTDKHTQFEDDLIYLKNNFSGVGLWPLPLVSDTDFPEVSRLLIKSFVAEDVDGILNTISNNYPELCEFACPNRWAFRLGIDLLLLFIVMYAVLALFSHRVRRFYNRHSTGFMLYTLLMVTVFLVSLMCDPFWKQKRDIIFLGAVLIVSAFFMIRKYSQAKQGPLP
ncbi:MAG: hypothetical protein L3K25_19625 [Gammaproteobacteria bacterium]|nr:hypothetical protein [Gammaproteobacteria bacterium]